MAINFRDPDLSKAYQNKKYLKKLFDPLTHRQIEFLANSISLQNPQLKIPNTRNSNIKEELIFNLNNLDNLNNFIEPYIEEMKVDLLPECEFDWLKGDLRKQVFCLHVLYNNPYIKGLTYDKPGSIQDLVYLYIDNLMVLDGNVSSSLGESFYSAEIDLKSRILKDIQQSFHEIRNHDNYTKWLKKGDYVKIEWSKNYLQQNNLYYDHFTIDNDNLDMVRDVVLASFDLMNLYYNYDHTVTFIASDKKLFIDKMKRAWSQKKYRDAGKTKTPYHLPLTKIAKARLEKLAEIKGLSTTTLLDVLINSAYERDCIDEDGNELY